jgi:hypothetical protein
MKRTLSILAAAFVATALAAPGFAQNGTTSTEASPAAAASPSSEKPARHHHHHGKKKSGMMGSMGAMSSPDASASPSK